MTDLSPDQERAISIAHQLVDAGVPIFTAWPNHGERGGEFHYPAAWQEYRPNHRQVEIWRPGAALCAVTGVVLDVLDVDPRNDGERGVAELDALGAWPDEVIGLAYTPSMGRHLFIPATGLAKGKPADGVDLQAGAPDGTGRGFVFIAPTVRLSKHGPDAGQAVAYRWDVEPLPANADRVRASAGYRALVEYVQAARAPRTAPVKIENLETVDLDDPFDTPSGIWTAAEADRVIGTQLQAVRNAPAGTVNDTLGGAARVLGRYVAGGYLAESEAARMLLDALEAAPAEHSDAWNAANGRGWTAATVISAGMANGAQEPWQVVREPEPVKAVGQVPMGASAVPALEVRGAAEMAYWLQSYLGTGTLSGFFRRDGQVVHTPRINDLGYVPPPSDADSNGPVQIQRVSPGQLAAKIQYSHRCYKITKDKKSGEEHQSDALFPLQAAQRAVDAPEAMGMLRPLAGITLTPMVRADGTILGVPGYDEQTGYLFLPDPGVAVPPVPLEPSADEAARAVGLLDEMTEGFPWEGADDKANYYGLLLTPLLRLLAPPSYKLFGIGAHQPASGKTLLADLVRAIHGGVMRSEMPEDDAEMRKQTTAILSTTSAPVVHIDNVTGVLKSPCLAGLLTAGGQVTDRELGTGRMVTSANDRVWVVTGNNLSLGGDLVRRAVIIQIDPDMVNPESRTDFKIKDLPGWVAEHRSEILYALLVMVRRWVALGAVPAVRSQSDGFARWESVVAGILAACGVPGAFDAQSGQRAASGGDDDGLARVLGHLWEKFGDRPWTVAEALTAPQGAWMEGDRDWLPAPVVDKLARSETGGRISLGWWLRNRNGRWVTGLDGRPYVIRKHGVLHRTDTYKIERR